MAIDHAARAFTRDAILKWLGLGFGFVLLIFASVAHAETPSAPIGETVQQAACRIVETAAHDSGLSVDLLTRLIWAESRFQARGGKLCRRARYCSVHACNSGGARVARPLRSGTSNPTRRQPVGRSRAAVWQYRFGGRRIQRRLRAGFELACWNRKPSCPNAGIRAHIDGAYCGRLGRCGPKTKRQSSRCHASVLHRDNGRPSR